MKISSSAFEHDKNIPARYTCDGVNVNPPLNIEDVPNGAKSLVLIVEDPDAPNGLWVHWLMWNIPANLLNIMEHAVPLGAVEGTTSSGKTGYSGPCPPSGVHHYFFKLYALDEKLSLPVTATRDELKKAMSPHLMEKAKLIGLYSR